MSYMYSIIYAVIRDDCSAVTLSFHRSHKRDPDLEALLNK